MADKVALVTGANKGIGFELVRRLAQQGIRVVLASRDVGRGEQAQASLAKEGLDVDVIQLDVSQRDSIERAAEELAKRYKKLDILVNNAGIFAEGAETGLTVTPEVIKQVMDTNTFGPLLLTQKLFPLLKASGQARVLNVSSGLGQLNDMENAYPSYSISKTALNAVTRILAAELAPYQIMVNTICPGWVRTDMGGPNAERSVEESVAGILPLLIDPAERRTGHFMRDGQDIPW